MIETLIFALSMITVQIIEYRNNKSFNPYQDVYSQVLDMNDFINQEVQKRLGQELQRYAERLKAEKDDEKNMRRTKSMCDLGDREREEDDRRVNTDPLDSKKRKMYEDRLNPYH